MIEITLDIAHVLWKITALSLIIGGLMVVTAGHLLRHAYR